MTLHAGQQRRQKEQTFGLNGSRRGWGDLKVFQFYLFMEIKIVLGLFILYCLTISYFIFIILCAYFGFHLFTFL